MNENIFNISFNGEPLDEIFSSKDFLSSYHEYKRKISIHDLTNFLDNIETNKKYYRTDIQKNRRYKKNVTEDTEYIKNFTSMVNKLTDMNYESLKIDIMKLITKDHLLPYIIETLVEKCILHHRYINLYVGIIKDIHNKTFRCKNILLKLCDKYHSIFYNEEITSNDDQYQHLCNVNKRTDNIIGFSLMITYLEKEKIITNYVEKVLDPFMDRLVTITNDIELYQLLLSFYNISSIYYTLIPKKYVTILNTLKEKSDSSKVRFKIMDILGE